MELSLAITIFVSTYILIIFGLVHRTVAALTGTVLILALGVIKPAQAFNSIDFDTVGLLTGMMIIVGITKRTGLFEFLAIKAAQGVKGEPIKILASLCLITAVFSAFLDNVTTVMLIIPVTFAITQKLRISPVPFLMGIIIASNIGGTATLVGDPPNIMISGFTGLGFMDFVGNLLPAVLVIYIVIISVIKLIYRHQIETFPGLQIRLMNLNAVDELNDRALLRKCLGVIFTTVLGFVLHQQIRLEPAFIAMLGACILIFISKSNVIRTLKYIEWSVIIFFISLFIIIGAMEQIGLFEKLAVIGLDITGGNILPTALIILWLSAILSAFVDNIPFVAAMIPLIQDMGRLGGIHDLNFLWWSLSLGSCLGGNGTAIGASANVVVIGMAEKRGIHISFIDFMKVAFPLMILSIIISTGYLLGWYCINITR